MCDHVEQHGPADYEGAQAGGNIRTQEEAKEAEGKFPNSSISYLLQFPAEEEEEEEEAAKRRRRKRRRREGTEEEGKDDEEQQEEEQKEKREEN